MKDSHIHHCHGELHLGANGLQKCARCLKTIPAKMQRVSFQYSTRWNKAYIRICAKCITALAAGINLSSVTIEELVQEEKERVRKKAIAAERELESKRIIAKSF